jgi:chemotaxis protein CheD
VNALPTAASRISEAADGAPTEASLRIWNHVHRMAMVKLFPGQVYVGDGAELIGTVLGSCIAACIWDELAGVGGMNHFMLPIHGEGSDANTHWHCAANNAATRYGNHAMEYLINELLKRGASRTQLKVKVFGGAQVMSSLTDIGQRNILFVSDYIKTEGLTLVAQDVGDIYARKVEFFPSNGRARVKRLRAERQAELARTEHAYRETLARGTRYGDIELF